MTIYTRNYGRQNRNGVRYSPPPGYDGNAFSEPQDVKLHEAEDDLRQLPRQEPEETSGNDPGPHPDEMPDLSGEMMSPSGSAGAPGNRAEDRDPADIERDSADILPVQKLLSDSQGEGGRHGRDSDHGFRSMEDLFRQLRGRFGREELILVLVMLLVSSEGASIELVLLALVLIAG